MPRSIFLSLTLIAATPLLAQTAPAPTLHTAADLQQREAKLIETAKTVPTGFAVATIDDTATTAPSSSSASTPATLNATSSGPTRSTSTRATSFSSTAAPCSRNAPTAPPPAKP